MTEHWMKHFCSPLLKQGREEEKFFCVKSKHEDSGIWKAFCVSCKFNNNHRTPHEALTINMAMNKIILKGYIYKSRMSWLQCTRNYVKFWPKFKTNWWLRCESVCFFVNIWFRKVISTSMYLSFGLLFDILENSIKLATDWYNRVR